MNPQKISKIATVLIKSQLRSARAGRAGSSIFSRPSIVLLVDLALFVAIAAIVRSVVAAVGQSPVFPLDTLTRQVLVFLPALITPAIFVASIIFELNVSSKFASSDTLNWLPVSQAEYVTASTLSVCYMYSLVIALALGATLALAVNIGLFGVWVVAAVLSLFALFIGGLLVEMLRATLNRVSSSMLGRSRRGALALRLVVSILVIALFQLFFNPLVLLGTLTAFTSSANTAFFVPFVWPSESIGYSISGGYLLALTFFALTVCFTAFLLFLAIRVRARFWSPYPVTVRVSDAEYAPGIGRLARFGFSSLESALVRKDLKGLTRRREMVPYLAIPFVMIFVLLIPQYAAGSQISKAPAGAFAIPLLFVSGVFTLLFSAVSIGQEGKAIINVYSFPVSPEAFLKAKATLAATFSLAIALLMIVLSNFLARLDTPDLLAMILLAPVLALEETFIGLGFGVRYPDFADRPRPRFVRPLGMLIALPLGLVLMLITMSPIIVGLVSTDLLFSLGSLFEVLIAAALVFAVVITILFYRWALSGTRRLLTEVQV
jgi:hypothetical protein